MTQTSKIIIFMFLSVMLLAVVSGSMMLNFKKTVIEQSVNTSPVVHSTSPTGIRSIVVVDAKIEMVDSLQQAITEDLIDTAPKIVKDSAKHKIASLTPVTHSPKPNSHLRSKTSPSSIEQPSLIIYEDELVIEFPKSLASSSNLKQAIARVLLSKSPRTEKNLLSKKPFDMKVTPYFYKKVVDENNHPIRYPKQAYNYANFLLANMTESFSDEEGSFVLVYIPLIQSDLTGPAKNYQTWVEDYSKEFGIKPSLIYAIMETESAFNSHAVSKSNAIGLMQIKANAAGRDVFNLVDEKPGQPTKYELFNSENNIRMGTAYLSLLKNDYLSAVKNEKTKEMMAISSYNGGLSTVLSLFGDTRKEAFAKVNRMSPKQVYHKLKYKHKSAETRAYLSKVLKANAKYNDLLNVPTERYSGLSYASY